MIEERRAEGKLQEERSTELDRLWSERAVLMERLAALRDLSHERERRVAELRAALAALLKTHSRMPPPTPEAEAVRMTEAERATWERELARIGHPNKGGKMWETFEDFPPPRLRDRLREHRRRR